MVIDPANTQTSTFSEEKNIEKPSTKNLYQQYFQHNPSTKAELLTKRINYSYLAGNRSFHRHELIEHHQLIQNVGNG